MMTPPRIPAALDIRVIPPVTDLLRHRLGAAGTQAVSSERFVRTRDLTAELRASEPCVLHAMLTVADDEHDTTRLSFLRVELAVHVYACYEDESDGSSASTSGSDEKGGEGLRDAMAREMARVAHVTELPSAGLEGVWAHLHFASGVKRALVGYVRAAQVLRAHRVSAEIVGWNGVMLLHGPPGTGKTSACRGLAQTVAVHMRMRDAVLVEVRVERVMSKWFAESGKKVSEVFDLVRRLAAGRSFVMVVLDEVETVGLSRKGRVENGEPGDAIRVVNALLGGLDGLRGVGNCVVVCTSNLMDAVDAALLDRVDAQVHVGSPGLRARIRILGEVREELVAKGVVGAGVGEWSVERVCAGCEGVSGRGLRKVAVLGLGGDVPVAEQAFLEGVWRALREMVAVGKQADARRGGRIEEGSCGGGGSDGSNGSNGSNGSSGSSGGRYGDNGSRADNGEGRGSGCTARERI